MERLKKQLRFRAVFLFHLPSLPGNRILGAPPVARRGAPPTPQGGPVGPARRGHGVDVALDRAERRIGLGSIWIARAWMPCGSGRMARMQQERNWSMERFEPFVLGQCPFCNGGVTAAVRRFDGRTIGMWYVAFDYDLRPGCPNGCPIDRFDMTRLFFDGWTVASDYDPTPVFRRAWARDVRMFHNRPACPRCGRPARLRSGSDFAMGCPWCGLWAEPERRDGPVSIMSLVGAWNHLADGKEGR